MKTRAVSLTLLTGALFLVGYLGSTPTAFHSGGVAECEGCHSMHSPKPDGTSLLIGTDASSTCLDCHQSAGDSRPTSYHVSTPEGEITAALAPKQRTPGGDFGWVKTTYYYQTTDTNNNVTYYTEDGQTHGHNIVAADQGYVADTDNTSAPGGSGFPSTSLGCTSCHDPHGRFRRLASGQIIRPFSTTSQPIKSSGSYSPSQGNTYEPTTSEAVGVYRLLAGNGYMVAGDLTFQGVPAAKAPSTYNQSEATNQVRVAYGVKNDQGHVQWGTWCATCHPQMHSTGNYVHPVDVGMSSTVVANYQKYVRSGDMGGGAGTTSYLSLVPFVMNTTSYTDLAAVAKNDNSQLGGPSQNDQVSCLSCHRAHASGMVHALRFDIGYEFMTKEGKYIGSDSLGNAGRAPLQHRGRTDAHWQAAYYDRLPTTWATYQRVLCNKCHAKD